MSTTQRRQPVSYAELQDVLRTGVFPVMGDPVVPGDKPYCLNCAHWNPLKDGIGECMNKAARKHALFGDGMLGSVKRLTTGDQCHCPEHEFTHTP